MKSIKLIAMLLLVLLEANLTAASTNVIAPPRVLYVEVDDLSTTRYGSWPLNRSYYARVIAATRSAGAKAVLIKIFFDNDFDGTPELAAEMTKSAVFIQGELIFDAPTDQEQTTTSLIP